MYPLRKESRMLTEPKYRDACRQLLEWSCGGPVGLPQTDPNYLYVTEGREPLHSKYGTSCGELPHWELFRIGIRSKCINRKEAHGYQSGMNIWDLASAPFTKSCSVDDVYQPGDIVYIWSRPDTEDAHAMCVVEYTADRRQITVAEYGQPGGALHVHQLTPGTDSSSGKARPALFCGTRALQRWVPLMAAVTYADSRGELVDPDLACLNVPDAPIGDAA